MASPRRKEDYQIGIICALATEKAAMVAMLDETYDKLPKDKADPNDYTFGRIGEHDVVIACLPAGSMGNGPAATVVNNMTRSFSIKFGLMVGVGGGVWSKRTDIRLGDVAVSQPTGVHGGVLQWDYGKTENGGEFRRIGSLNKPPPVLLHALQALKTFDITDGIDILGALSIMIKNKPRMAKNYKYQGAEHDQLFKATYDHVSGETCECCDTESIVPRPPREDSTPAIHYGNIASGNQVMKHGATRDRISKDEDVICFEMEAAGLMDDFPCLVIRGICDYADSHKNKRWQPYAAATAAAFARVLLGFIDKQEVIETATSIAPADHVFMVPFDRDDEFVGREDILDQIEERLHAGRRVSLAGIGGVGKSQVAIEYAYRFHEKHPQRQIFWVYAASSTRFDQSYQEIADKLNIPRRDDPKVNKMKLVSDWLSDKSHGHWLMILDNADNRSLFFPTIDVNTSYESGTQPCLTDFLPLSFIKHGSIVITTRNRKLGTDLADGQDPIDVQPFTPTEAEQLLESKMLKGCWDVLVARDLLKILDYIPLAITQAAAYIRQNRVSMEKYLKALSQSESNLAEYLTTELLDPRRRRDTPSSVFLTWKLSFDQIKRDEPRAAEILSLMALLDRQGIPEMLLRQTEHLAVEDTNAIGTLQAFSLITAERDGETYSMHRLVQLCTQAWLSLQKSRDRWEEKALELLSKELPNGEHENRKKCEALLPHAIAVLKYRHPPNSNLLRADILYKLAWFDWRQGRYKHATTRCQESYSERQRILGPDDRNTLDSLGLLASAFWNQGRWKEAEELDVQVMETRSRVLGAEHPDTLTSMGDLASTYRNQGRWKEAEELDVQVMETRSRVLGAEHPSTLTSMLNLASTFWNQGRWKEAEELEVQVMETSSRVLGAEHPDTLTSIGNLASTYMNQGWWKEAEELEVQVMETSSRVLGAEHPDTLTSMNNLAHTLHGQGRNEEAIQLMKHVVETLTATIGANHPHTLTASSSLHAWTHGK